MTIPADETPVECIHRTCDQLDALHGLTTITGDRTRTLTQDIRDATRQLTLELDVTASLLTDAQEDLQAANDQYDHEAPL